MQIIPDAKLEGLRAINQAAAGMRESGATISNIINNAYRTKLAKIRQKFDMSTKMQYGKGQEEAASELGVGGPGGGSIGSMIYDAEGRPVENTYHGGTIALAKMLEPAMQEAMAKGDYVGLANIMNNYEERQRGLRARYDVGGGSAYNYKLLAGPKGGKPPKQDVAVYVDKQTGSPIDVELSDAEFNNRKVAEKYLRDAGLKGKFDPTLLYRDRQVAMEKIKSTRQSKIELADTVTRAQSRLDDLRSGITGLFNRKVNDAEEINQTLISLDKKGNPKPAAVIAVQKGKDVYFKLNPDWDGYDNLPDSAKQRTFYSMDAMQALLENMAGNEATSSVANTNPTSKPPSYLKKGN